MNNTTYDIYCIIFINFIPGYFFIILNKKIMVDLIDQPLPFINGGEDGARTRARFHAYSLSRTASFPSWVLLPKTIITIWVYNCFQNYIFYII